MSIFTVLWILWGVFFLTVELVALRRHPGGTLSETIWRWAAVKGYRWPHLVHLRRVVLALFMVELTIHFAAGRWWI